MSIVVRNGLDGGYTSDGHNSSNASIEVNSSSSAGFVIVDGDKRFEFNNFKLDMRYDNYWRIVLQDGDKELYRFGDDELRDSENNLIDIKNELETKQSLLFNSKTYDDYGKTRAVQHFMQATEDLTMPGFDTHIFIDLNSVSDKDRETYEIDYKISINGKDFGNFKKEVKDDRVYEEMEIESHILFEVLENINKALESESVAIKTENDFIPKDEVFPYLKVASVTAGEWFKQGSFSGISYFAVNDGAVNLDYIDSTHETKEKALAYHDGRVNFYSSDELKQLIDLLCDKGHSVSEVEKYFDEALTHILETSEPYKEVAELLKEHGLSDRLMVVSRKGKDNFIFPQIIGYDDNCRMVDTILLEAKPTQEEINKCLNILESVKNSLYKQAKEMAYERAIDYEAQDTSIHLNERDDEPRSKRYKQ